MDLFPAIFWGARRAFGSRAVPICVSRPLGFTVSTVFLLFLAEPAFSQEIKNTSVQAFILYCKDYLNGQTAFDQGLCMGAAEASAGYMAGLCAFGSEANRQLGANIPPEMTYGALIQTFINWAEANPKLWTINVGIGMSAAFKENFPCNE